MLYLLLGVVAFILFYLYELYAVFGGRSILKLLFFAGVFLILFSTCGAVAQTLATAGAVLWRLVLFGTLALLFLVLMLYSLFFAVPFSKTYVEKAEGQPKKVCRTGMYALCRHPGVLWFWGFYLFLWLALGGALLLGEFLLYGSLNLIYIVIQDRWSFLVCFEDYGDYKKSVPFLIPTGKSLRRCVQSFYVPKGGRTA